MNSVAATNGASNKLRNGAATEISPSYQHASFGITGHLPDEHHVHPNNKRPSNEYVLNVAFFSFFGFMIIQAGFAVMVGSQSMVADSEAMGVDAMTYLFNLCAERIKNAPYSAKELRLPADVRDYRRTLKRLYLELIPPFISVTTLLVVTIVTLRNAMETLFGYNGEDTDNDDAGDGEMVGVMLFFSTLNLLLDVVNVTCFARADQAYVNVIQNQEVKEEFKKSLRSRTPSEDLSLLMTSTKSPISHGGESEGIEVKELRAYGSSGIVQNAVVKEQESFELVNLNMCSAWTHVCADTMRSIAVLVAAAIAYLFEAVSPENADATAAVIVSLIIIVSLLPLLQGLYLTATEIWLLTREPPSGEVGVSLTV